MSKTKIRIVVFCMGAALAGLIALQAYWIKHDIDIKENQFDMMVNQALENAVEKIEQTENVMFMSKQGMLAPFKLNVQQHDSGIVFTLNDSIIPTTSDPLKTLKDIPVEGKTSHMIIESINGNRKTKQIIQQYDSTFEAFDRSVLIKDKRIQSIEERKPFALDSIRNDVEVRMSSKLDRIGQLFWNYTKEFDLNRSSISNRVNPKQIDKILHDELIECGINLNYNFGLLSGTDDTVVFVKNKSDIKSLGKSKYRTFLFPNDIFFKPDLLLLTFPNQINYVLGEVWPVMLSSFLFTLIIVSGFAYTVHIIFKQKKLADIKNDFINNMTHEFKTPIATIAIAADTLRNEKVQANKEMLDYYAGIIKQENTRMNKQVNHVLQMAQIDKGELKLNFQQADIHELIKDVLQANRLQIDSRNGKINLQLNATSCFFDCDVSHLTNAISNLVDNAVKYSPDELEITIATTSSETGIQIAVSDKGMGMNTETQKKIFDKFYRATKGNLHDVKGFGLGLSYAKAIIEAHNGTIEVSSEPGRGSTFEIFIPFKSLS